MRQILQFLRLLKREKIPFVAIGMSAARLHGAPVMTKDFDLLVPAIAPDVLDRLVARSDAVLSGGREPPCAVNFTDDMPVDLVRRLSTHIALKYALRISKRVKVGGVVIPVLPLDEIIASKKLAGRPKDLAVIPILRSYERVRSKMRNSPAASRRKRRRHALARLMGLARKSHSAVDGLARFH